MQTQLSKSERELSGFPKLQPLVTIPALFAVKLKKNANHLSFKSK